MGGVKHKAMDEQQEKSAAWERKAKYEGWECSRCGCTPPLEERELWFETKLCSFCYQVGGKD